MTNSSYILSADVANQVFGSRGRVRNLCYKGRLTFTVSLGDKLINPILSPYEPYMFFFFFRHGPRDVSGECDFCAS